MFSKQVFIKKLQKMSIISYHKLSILSVNPNFQIAPIDKWLFHLKKKTVLLLGGIHTSQVPQPSCWGT